MSSLLPSDYSGSDNRRKPSHRYLRPDTPSSHPVRTSRAGTASRLPRAVPSARPPRGDALARPQTARASARHDSVRHQDGMSSCPPRDAARAHRERFQHRAVPSASPARQRTRHAMHTASGSVSGPPTATARHREPSIIASERCETARETARETRTSPPTARQDATPART